MADGFADLRGLLVYIYFESCCHRIFVSGRWLVEMKKSRKDLASINWENHALKLEVKFLKRKLSQVLYGDRPTIPKDEGYALALPPPLLSPLRSARFFSKSRLTRYDLPMIFREKLKTDGRQSPLMCPSPIFFLLQRFVMGRELYLC